MSTRIEDRSNTWRLSALVHGWAGATGLALGATAGAQAALDADADGWLMSAVPVENAVQRAAREIDALLGHPCDEPAELFVETGSILEEDLPLGLRSLDSEYVLVFLPGTPMSEIVRAVNAFSEPIGVRAESSVQNPDRMRVWSVAVEEAVRLQVRDVAGTRPVVFDRAVGGEGGVSSTDEGALAVPGDTNCDRDVNVHDLLTVINEWGSCDGCAGDVTRDGTVGPDDLLAVLAYWD